MTKPHHAFSFWERQAFLGRPDFLVVGAGITGLSTAIELAEARPGARILVLERGMLPSGASTKNAGFACFGSPTELIADSRRADWDTVRRLTLERYEGLGILLSRLGEAATGFLPCGGYELFTDRDEALYHEVLVRLPEFNRAFSSIGPEVYRRADEKISKFGFAGIRHIIHNPYEGQIDTGRTMHNLSLLAREKGIEILTGADVQQVEPGEKGVEVVLPEGRFTADKVVLAVNGFAKRFLPELPVQPARAQVLVTEAIETLPFDGVFHYEEGYYYFRNLGNRILLGGGRNIDLEQEMTDAPGITQNVQSALEKLLMEVILPGREVKIADRWSGTMGLGPVKSPIIERVHDRMACVVRFGGMGVALGSLSARKAAQVILAD